MQYREPADLPAGTQVVLKQEIVDERGYRWKAGSAGVVTRSPARHDAAYEVEMNDRTCLWAARESLAVQRLSVPLRIQVPKEEFDPQPHLVLLSVTGSQAYGLAQEDSDIDLKGVYVLPWDALAGLYRYPEEKQVHYHAETPARLDPALPLRAYLGREIDTAYYEVGKFITLALQANPNILEMLWTPLWEAVTPVGTLLREHRHLFWSRHLESSFSAYAQGQFRKLRRSYESTGMYRSRHAVHLIRLLYSALHLLRTREPMLDVGEHRALLLAIKDQTLGMEETEALADRLIQTFNAEAARSQLPEHPDYEAAHQLLLEIRRQSRAQEGEG